jgi:5-methyltetrahydrofolate--homocysteine methyltransferase
MPERKWINAGFMGMALGRGLNMAIANPSSELIMALAFAGDVLSGRDYKMRRYVERYSGVEPSGEAKAAAKDIPPAEKVFNCVLEGDEDAIPDCIAEALKCGISAKTLVDDSLIPAINKVGDLYDCKKYFLPQLIMSADAMRRGFQVLEPHLQESMGSEDAKAVIIMATVEGDIHDIGKNIVTLMLRNYGFEVIDLGKDVAASRIIAAAKKHKARIIGLSALMTTTMIKMEEVIKLAREEGLEGVRFIIGGAVVDQDYADQIGADAYAADAMDSVRIAQKFTSAQ